MGQRPATLQEVEQERREEGKEERGERGRGRRERGEFLGSA